MNSLTEIPKEFDLLREYIVDYSDKHVAYHIPAGLVKYDTATLQSFFGRVEVDIHHFPPLDSREVIEGLIEPRQVAHTINCYFKEREYTDVEPGVKRLSQ